MSNTRRPSSNIRGQNVNISHITSTPDSLSESDITDSHDRTSNQVNAYHQSDDNNDTSTDAEEKSTELKKSSTLLSKVTSIKIDDTKIVPASERRGILAKFCIVPEYQDARELPDNLRKFIVFVIAFCAMLGPMGTSILLPASDDAVRDLDTTITILNVAIGVYLITLGVVPLWWSSLSERHGRRSIYITSFILYLCFTIGCALAPTVHILIGFRVLSGGCAASVQSVGAGTIGDLYPVTKRGSAMGLFYLGPLAGPLLSPIIGGAITSSPKFGWRATQWFLICLSGGCCLLIIFCLPETLRKQDSRAAIRKILRDRRRQTNKNDIENQTQELNLNNQETESQETESVSTTKINNEEDDTQIQDSIYTSGHIADVSSVIESIDSAVFDETDSDGEESIDPADEEEVEHLQKILTAMSARQSFSRYTSSRRGSIASHASKKTQQFSGDDSTNSADTLADGLEDSENETPIMDTVVPLSKVPTYSTLKTKENPKEKREKLANDLDHLHDVAHGNKFQLSLHFAKLYLFGSLKSFVFMRYPPVFLAVMYSAPCFAALYVQNMTLTYMYSRPPYNFSPMLVGLVYVPNSVTYFIASIWGGKFNDYLLRKKIEKYGIVAPEARFGINVYVAAAMLPASMLITGWCLDFKEHWVTPLIGTALFGFAQMIVIGVTITYLADCLPGKGATGVALSNFIRMIMAAGVSFATEPLIEAIGVGPLFSICAGVCAILSVLLFIIIRYGDHWRETYDLESLYDIVDGV